MNTPDGCGNLSQWSGLIRITNSKSPNLSQIEARIIILLVHSRSYGWTNAHQSPVIPGVGAGRPPDWPGRRRVRITERGGTQSASETPDQLHDDKHRDREVHNNTYLQIQKTERCTLKPQEIGTTTSTSFLEFHQFAANFTQLFISFTVKSADRSMIF